MEITTNLYDLNKNLVSQLSPLPLGEVKEKIQQIADHCTQGYYLFICPDNRQYVVFNYLTEEPNNFYKELCEVIFNRGTVLAVDEKPDDLWEIWIRDAYDKDKIYLYQLITYEAIEC